jgi:hypothetical protein
MSILTDDLFCNFILLDDGYYECSKCKMSIVTEDLTPPTFPCRMAGLSSKEPNLVDKIKHFSNSLIDHAKNNFVLATDSEIERRFKICETCDSFKHGSCLECGCPIVRTKNYISKLSWASEKCPLNKW